MCPISNFLKTNMDQNEAPVNSPVVENTAKNNTVMAIVAYIIFFLPLLTSAKNDPFVKFHVKQGLIVFICGVIAYIGSMLPVLNMIDWLLHLVVFVLFIIGVINAATGKEKDLPVVGKFAKQFKF